MNNETKRKKTEKELRQYRDQLEKLVEIRTKKLRESEEKYRELFEEAPYAYFSIGTDKSIKRCNKAAIKLLISGRMQYQKFNLTTRLFLPQQSGRHHSGVVHHYHIACCQVMF